MINILLLTVEIIFLLFFCGLGFTSIFLPKKLREEDGIWLVPWLGAMFIATAGVLLSIGKVNLISGQYVILLLSFLLICYAGLNKMISYKTNKFFFILVILTIFIFLFNIFPLFFRAGFPTTISLGNLDPLSYTTVADFLKSNTIFHGKELEHYKPYLWSIGDLLHYSFRWGSPMLLGFLASVLKVDSFEIFSIVLTLFFVLSFPLVYILAKKILDRNSFILILLIFITYAMNSTLLYMVYNVFFGQFIFTGIFILIITTFLDYNRNGSRSLQFINKHDLISGFAFASITTIYPEGLIFSLFPVLFYAFIYFFFKKKY